MPEMKKTYTTEVWEISWESFLNALPDFPERFIKGPTSKIAVSGNDYDDPYGVRVTVTY